MTVGFWTPYRDFADANRRLCRFTDVALGRSCGITFSDGSSVAVVRKPTADLPSGNIWLNFLREHVSVPKPTPAPPAQGRLARLERFVDRAFQLVGESELAQAQAQQAVAEAVVGPAIRVVHDDVWVPAHEFLLRHKLFADGLGVVFDAVGVAAGVAFVIVAAPEVAGGAVVIGTIGLITGAAAATGSLVLLAADGSVFGFELFGKEAIARRLEENKVVQWSRIIGTLMILPDIPLGGPRALKEIETLGNEAREAAMAARKAEVASDAKLVKKAKIRNPERHPGSVQHRAAQANRLARRAEELRDEVDAARARIRLLLVRDVGAAFVATPGTTILVTGAPPGVVLSPERREHDEQIMSLLSPEGGMPRDVKLEVRVSGIDTGSEE